MSFTQIKILFQKILQLTLRYQAERADFVDFLRIRDERRAAADRITANLAKLDALDIPSLSDEEINEEIAAVRALRRQAFNRFLSVAPAVDVAGLGPPTQNKIDAQVGPAKAELESNDAFDFATLAKFVAIKRDAKLTVGATQVSEPSFAAVWNNDDDAIYDKI
jgi:hypothetical protein